MTNLLAWYARLAAEEAAMATDHELIVQTAHDYFEGWYDGDVTRMDRVLHPDLVKRSPGEYDGATLTKKDMVEATAEGEGTREADDRRLKVEVCDICGDIASAVVWSAPYREYLHLIKTGDGWQILNALYLPQ
jgi:ketosteroid isomerase-like protein